MSERTARKYALEPCALASEGFPHVAHPGRSFVDVWPEVEALLRQDGRLQAKKIWTELNERYPARFSAGQLRTLQRRCFHRAQPSGGGG